MYIAVVTGGRVDADAEKETQACTRVSLCGDGGGGGGGVITQYCSFSCICTDLVMFVV